MTQVSVETDLFSLGAEGRVIVFFAARNRLAVDDADKRMRCEVAAAFARIKRRGWRVSIAEMFGEDEAPTVYDTGFTHDVDIVGVFEAPTLSDAYHGIALLQEAGWDALFTTEWQVGPREFQPVPSPVGRDRNAPWAFFALWEWNDAWQSATQQERVEYDIGCYEAFISDIDSGISIAGRHRLDLSSSWHHLGIWEAPTFDHITKAMAAHERVADFKFTTSRHYVGRRRTLADYLGVTP